MTVREFIALLEQYPDDLRVVIDDPAGCGGLAPPRVLPLQDAPIGSITGVMIATPFDADYYRASA